MNARTVRLLRRAASAAGLPLTHAQKRQWNRTPRPRRHALRLALQKRIEDHA